MARALASLCVLAVLAGCGGDDRKAAEQAVRDFVEAVNEGDADRYCEELTTAEFVKESTFTNDEDRARAACKREFRAIRALRIELVRIVSTRVEGDTATVRAVIASQSRRLRQALRLEKEGGDWKLAGAAGN